MNSREHQLAFAGYLLLFAMLVYPMVFALSFFKLFLFAVILLTVGLTVLQTGRTGLHCGVALWTLFLMLLSFIFVLEGFARGAPGAGRMAQIYIAWPLIYLLVIAGFRSERIIAGLTKTVIASTICVGSYSITYLLARTNILPGQERLADLINLGWPSEAFGWHDGYIGMDFPGLNSMFFLLPFCVALLITTNGNTVNLVGRRFWLWVAFLLGSTATLLSGRRALYLVSLTAAAFTFLFTFLLPQEQRRLSRQVLIRAGLFSVVALATVIFVLNIAYGTSLSGLSDRFTVGFDFSPTSEDHGATERREQYHAMLAEWTDHPILGLGHGSSAYGSIRSQDTPWNYELYYMALLFQTGLAGFTAYTCGILWIFWKGIQVIRTGSPLSATIIANLVGLTSILIASATNPYLARYDAMWVIFLPLGVINFCLLEREEPAGFSKPSGSLETT